MKERVITIVLECAEGFSRAVRLICVVGLVNVLKVAIDEGRIEERALMFECNDFVRLATWTDWGVL